MTLTAEQLSRNLTGVLQRVMGAAKKAGRRPGEVRLVAVTKYVNEEITRLLVQCGCSELGESRPQDLWRKAAALADRPIAWHLIGHLQTNKVRRTLPLVSLVHSLDSFHLLAEIERESARLGRRTAGLLEVNISGEAAKHGFAPAELPAVVDRLREFPHVEIRGLMGMARESDREGDVRRQFASLRMLRDELAPRLPAGTTWPELSMGMSGDFEQAIAEGATLVRVGSALFAEGAHQD